MFSFSVSPMASTTVPPTLAAPAIVPRSLDILSKLTYDQMSAAEIIYFISSTFPNGITDITIVQSIFDQVAKGKYLVENLLGFVPHSMNRKINRTHVENLAKDIYLRDERILFPITIAIPDSIYDTLPPPSICQDMLGVLVSIELESAIIVCGQHHYKAMHMLYAQSEVNLEFEGLAVRIIHEGVLTNSEWYY
jgi:hypothetical protein